MAHELTERQRRFALLYVAGPEDVAGNGTEAYFRAYGCKRSAAGDGASRLLARPKVRAYMRDLRAEAAEAAKDRLRDWWQLVPKAQKTLEDAMSGAYAEDQDAGRNRVQAAQHILDRAMGSIRHQHEHKLEGEAIVVHVAGEPVQQPNGDAGRIPNASRRSIAARSEEEPPQEEEGGSLADWFDELDEADELHHVPSE